MISFSLFSLSLLSLLSVSSLSLSLSLSHTHTLSMSHLFRGAGRGVDGEYSSTETHHCGREGAGSARRGLEGERGWRENV